MSTFRLEPEHYLSQLARSTLLSKTDPHSRLSGAPSVRPNSPEGNPCVLETFQNYRARRHPVNPLQSQDFHLLCTAGSCHPDWKIKRGELFATTRRNASSALGWQFGHKPKRKTTKPSKDRLEVLLFAKPFRNLVPECEPRDPGSIGGLLIGCH